MAGFAGDQVFAGGAAPHRRQLVDRLADTDPDVLAPFVPTAVSAHDLPPDGQHAVLPQVVREVHDRRGARIVVIEREAARHQCLQRRVVQVDVCRSRAPCGSSRRDSRRPRSSFP